MGGEDWPADVAVCCHCCKFPSAKTKDEVEIKVGHKEAITQGQGTCFEYRKGQLLEPSIKKRESRAG